MLSRRLEGEPLLPFLQRVRVPVQMDDLASFIFLLSPSIRLLAFDSLYEEEDEDPEIQDARSFHRSFFHIISTERPEDLFVYHMLDRESYPAAVSQYLLSHGRLIRLEELDFYKSLRFVDGPTLAALSQLPALRKLRAWGHPHKPSHHYVTPTSVPFANLLHLELNHPSLQAISQLLASCSLRQASRLRTVDLATSTGYHESSSDEFSIAAVQRNLAAIRAALPDELHSFSLELDYTTLRGPSCTLSELFSSYLSLRDLRKFDITFVMMEYPPHLPDADARAFAAAWPELEEFNVSAWSMQSPVRTNARLLTVQGLAELAAGCPKLRDIRIPALDVSVLPEESALPPEGHRQVRHFDARMLVRDKGVKLEEVASLLDRLFPELEEYYFFGVGSSQSWFEAHTLMRGIRAARRRSSS